MWRDESEAVGECVCVCVCGERCAAVSLTLPLACHLARRVDAVKSPQHPSPFPCPLTWLLLQAQRRVGTAALWGPALRAPASRCTAFASLPRTRQRRPGALSVHGRHAASRRPTVTTTVTKQALRCGDGDDDDDDNDDDDDDDDDDDHHQQEQCGHTPRYRCA